MEIYKIENLSFSYPNKEKKVLNNINLTINKGEFVTLCGKSGCGKTTFLRLLKTILSPFGKSEGIIYFNGTMLSDIDNKIQASEICFVMQNPDNQIVCDKVWHELAFGLESLSLPTTEIRTRVAEIASFFGIQNWFHKKTNELSGGQKQLLNLASVMVMQPSVLILDEPTSQLDPIAAQEFLKTLEKINRELGTTVILSEHRLEDAFPISDRTIVMEQGKIIADTTPRQIGDILKDNDMFLALPTPIKVHNSVDNNLNCPISVREGKKWLEDFSKTTSLHSELIPNDKKVSSCTKPILEVKDVWFRYDKNSPDVVKGLNFEAVKGEFLGIVGGNGTGKTTALSIISGLYKPYRGNVLINGKKLSKIDNLYSGVLGVLPQNPQVLFVKKTVYLDLMEMLSELNITETEKKEKVKHIASICSIGDILESHPYDLSGGEQQRAALAKILLKNPEILLLDEPTKGMDAHFKETFAEILLSLKEQGVTVIMVSHDIEFCAEHADRCALFFDGNIVSAGTPREFFSGKTFYTTSANRMARTHLPQAVTTEDIILACGGNRFKKKQEKINFTPPEISVTHKDKPNNKPSIDRIILGAIFAILFIMTEILEAADMLNIITPLLRIVNIIEITGTFICFFPPKNFNKIIISDTQSNKSSIKRTIITIFILLIAIPFTVFIGTELLDDRKFYFISLLIILEITIPFGMIFENRKPQAREIIIISVLCALAVAGRSAFFMLPQFKPVIAIVIIAGVCFGGETGFLVGAITGFVSNFIFGQGPWTPWQMFSFGLIGFVSGIIFNKKLLPNTVISLSIFGGLATLIIYGGIMNPASVLMSQSNPTLKMIIASYIAGLPLDIIHSFSTSFFLWFIAEPMIEKLERIKTKYGLIKKTL